MRLFRCDADPYLALRAFLWCMQEAPRPRPCARRSISAAQHKSRPSRFRRHQPSLLLHWAVQSSPRDSLGLRLFQPSRDRQSQQQRVQRLGSPRGRTRSQRKRRKRERSSGVSVRGASRFVSTFSTLLLLRYYAAQQSSVWQADASLSVLCLCTCVEGVQHSQAEKQWTFTRHGRNCRRRLQSEQSVKCKTAALE